jgi:hypothetical protein
MQDIIKLTYIFSMATKKGETPAKTAPKKAVASKKVIPKETPAPAPKKRKEKVLNEKAQVTLTSFTMKALIPTMAYGNIAAEITVTAPTIEQAHEYCLPYIKHLYAEYAETPRDGRSASNIMPPKPSVTSQERTVAPQVVTPTGPAAPVPMPSQPAQPSAQIPAKEESNSIAQPSSNVVSFEKSGAIKKAPIDTSFIKPAGAADAEDSAAFKEAEKAINSIGSRAALDLVEGKVRDSGKFSSNEKDRLYTTILKKRSSVN